MEKVPAKTLKRYLKDNHVQLLFEMTETILKILEYKKVRGTTSDNLYVYKERLKKEIVGINLRDATAIKMGPLYTEKAGKNDIDRAISLREHINFLYKHFDPEIDIIHPGLGRSFSFEDLIDRQRRQEEENAA